MLATCALVSGRSRVMFCAGAIASATLGASGFAHAQCGSWVSGFGVPGITVGALVSDVHAWDRDGSGPMPPKIVMIGSFGEISGITARNIVQFDPATNVWSGLGDVGDGLSDVRAVTSLPNGDLVVTGSFTTAGGVGVSNIARFDGMNWYALGTGLSGGVTPGGSALAVMPNGDLIVGGPFNTAGSNPASGIARWNGSSWSTLGSGVAGSVRALVVMPNGDLIVAGSFTSAGGVPNTANIARWNGTSWSALASGSSSAVRALAVLADGSLIAPVNFSGSNGLCRWNGSAWVNYSGGPFNNTINSLIALPDGGFVVGGVFGTVGSLTVNGIVRRVGSSWVPLGSGTNGGTVGMALIGASNLYIGGSFSIAGGSPASRLARYNLGQGISVLTPPSDASVPEGGTLVLSATPAAGFTNVSVRWQRNGVNINNGVAGASVGGGTVSGALQTLASPTNATPATLTIANFKPSDAGTFTAVFTGDCGGATSTPAIVTLSAPCEGDFNSDGQVDNADFVSFVEAYVLFDCLDPAMPPGCPADLNGDELVDNLDFSLFVDAYNQFVCP